MSFALRVSSALLGEYSETVFEKSDSLSDVTFYVEDRQLHFTRLFLQAASPVFERMFTSDFKDSQTIPLPGKKFKDMDIFLQNIHPVHAWKPLNDTTLRILLPLAIEYQTDHIVQKCERYIRDQTQLGNKVLSEEWARKIFQYTQLCDQFGLTKSLTALIQHTSKIPLRTLESYANYKDLSEATKIAILRGRCMSLER